jgi:hypothetical protein
MAVYDSRRFIFAQRPQDLRRIGNGAPAAQRVPCTVWLGVAVSALDIAAMLLHSRDR